MLAKRYPDIDAAVFAEPLGQAMLAAELTGRSEIDDQDDEQGNG